METNGNHFYRQNILWDLLWCSEGKDKYCYYLPLIFFSSFQILVVVYFLLILFLFFLLLQLFISCVNINCLGDFSSTKSSCSSCPFYYSMLLYYCSCLLQVISMGSQYKACYFKHRHYQKTSKHIAFAFK